MTAKIIANGILRALGIILAVCIGVYFLYQIQTVILYLVVALILTLIGNPILDFLKKRLKFKHTLAAAFTIVFFVLIIVGFMLLFIPLIINQGESLSLLNTTEIEQNILRLMDELTVFLESHHIDAEALLRSQKNASNLNITVIPDFLNTLLSTISSFGMGLASVLFITFFFLKDRRLFIEGAKKLIPDSHEEQILNSLDKINVLLSRYFIGLLVQLLVVFILYMIVLLIFGVENAIVIAFLCGILNIVPYIGPIIATVLAAILTMINNLGGDFQTETLPTTIYVLIGFSLVQFIDNNFSQPLIFSKSVSSHPLEIFLVILIAGFLFGIVGMIVAVPLFTILKVIGKEFFPENVLIQMFTKNI
ncbi:AI-2E family transporter [Flavobacterium sp. CYK-4]|uniref:AI-2E family transporter n=1 Tax=Flavobacterium lotistagni TaxID=2709660 RepID=UPI00140757F9|nr:AI-2E family transporter [Flavobacterium lotistagni]NHM06787.1 AI-2E family transporter [Flavobacterium lotistagni]